MKESRYTRAMDSIHIDAAAVERGLALTKAAEEGDKVICMKKRSSGYWKTAAAAAVLAVVVGVGGAVCAVNGRSGGASSPIEAPSHDFAITANAEELRRDVQLGIGKLTVGGGGIAFLEEENAFQIEQGVWFRLRVEGDNIESVTYSTEDHYSDNMRMKFALRNDFASLTVNNGSDYMISEDMGIPGCTCATVFTVPYENQLREEHFKSHALVTDDAEAAKAWSIPLQLYVLMDKVPAGDFYAENPDLIHGNETKIDNAVNESFANYFNENSDIAKITVTVNFSDGASQTEEIAFSCDLEEIEQGRFVPVLYASIGDEAVATADSAEFKKM